MSRMHLRQRGELPDVPEFEVVIDTVAQTPAMGRRICPGRLSIADCGCASRSCFAETSNRITS